MMLAYTNRPKGNMLDYTYIADLDVIPLTFTVASNIDLPRSSLST